MLSHAVDIQAKQPVESKSSRLDPPFPDSSSTESDSGFARLARQLSIKSNEKPLFPQSLAELLVYTAGVKYQGFSKLVEYKPHHQFSVSERTAGRILRENKADWLKHNITHLSRVYPQATRVASTNYDPIPYWAAGCQIVALNLQTLGESCLIAACSF